MALWIMWLIAAIAVFSLEIFTGTVYLLVLSLALAGTALAAYLGLNATACLFLAAFLSIIGMIFVYSIRRKHSYQTHLSDQDDLDLGQIAIVDSRLSSDLWQVNYRGSLWQARSSQKYDFQTGQSVKICGKNGIVLLIKPIENID